MRKKTHEEFIRQVFDLFGDEYSVLGKYSSGHIRVLIKHNRCGKEYEAMPSNLLRGAGCPHCAREKVADKQRKTHDKLIEEVYELVGNDYTVLSKYTGADKKIFIRHNSCGNEYSVVARNFLMGQRCPKCQRPNYNRDLESFNREVCDLVGEEYSVLGGYHDAKTKTLMLHSKCGEKYESTPDNFLQGARCPYCAMPIGEKRIMRWLRRNNIRFKTQYTFEGLRDKKNLRFDFAIFDHEGLKYLIEAFHFNKFYGGRTYEIMEYHDRLKDEFCIDNGIPLIRIPYWQYKEIESILKRELAQQPAEAVF